MTDSPAAAVVARRIWLALGLVAVAALALFVAGTRTQDHALRASFDAAAGLSKGMDVQLDGLDVGKVHEVRYHGGRAEVVLGIDDGPAWPLPRGTRAVLRHGTLIGSATRRVDLHPGPASAPDLPDGGVIAARDTRTPVEWDEVFGTLDTDTRAAARAAARRGAAVLRGREADLNRGLAAAPVGAEALAGVLDDVAADRAMLDRLVVQADRVTGTLAARRDRVRALVVVARETFGAFAQRSQGVRDTLDALPGALGQATRSLRRVRGTSASLRPVLRQLAPGARELRRLHVELDPALRALREVTPAGLRVTAAARSASAPVRRLLAELGPFLGLQAAPVLEDLAPMLGCITPYAPELTGFLATWNSWNHRRDAQTNYGRFHILEGLPTLTSLPGATPGGAAQFPGLQYSRGLAPGELAGRPKTDERCGYTAALRDPALDPEAGR